MVDDVVTETEVRVFGEKLRAFGDQLTPKEQLLLSEILMRASMAESDVDAHAMGLPQLNNPSWPQVRQQIASLVKQVADDYRRAASRDPLARPYIRHEA